MSGSSSTISTGLVISSKFRVQSLRPEARFLTLNLDLVTLNSRSVAVFDEGGLGHVDGQLADVRDVVGDAFEVLGDEEEAGGAGRDRGLGRHQPDEVAEEPL